MCTRKMRFSWPKLCAIGLATKKWLTLAVLAVAVATEDSKAADSRADERRHEDDHLYLKARLDGRRPSGPTFARTLHRSIGQGPDIEEQDRIIRDTYSPAYYEPIWVLDYRFLKSGGRKYVRGPGGQILILPKSYGRQGPVDPDDDARDYDSMIEHLRLKLLAEQRERERSHRSSSPDLHDDHY